MILRRKKNWIGHVLRREGLLKDVLEGRMEGKCTRGKPRKKFLDDLSKEYEVLKRKAPNREL